LNSAVNLVGAKKEKLVAGILMNLGAGINEYVMSSTYLLDALKVNREKGAIGEAFFYYEGFRKNSNKLADTLKATFYENPALVPLRGGVQFRPKAKIVNEDNAEKTGDWQVYSMKGYEDRILRVTNSSFAEIIYYFDIPDEAFYDIFIYSTPNTTWADSAKYTYYDNGKGNEVLFSQKNLNKSGWQKIGSGKFKDGNNVVLKLDNSNLKDGEYLVADAAMIILNRKLSPDVIVNRDSEAKQIPKDFDLSQNYPNPFNPATKINYTIPKTTFVSLKIYDVLGRDVFEAVNEEKNAGTHEFTFSGHNLSSGVYFYRLETENYSKTKKMILIK